VPGAPAAFIAASTTARILPRIHQAMDGGRDPMNRVADPVPCRSDRVVDGAGNGRCRRGLELFVRDALGIGGWTGRLGHGGTQQNEHSRDHHRHEEHEPDRPEKGTSRNGVHVEEVSTTVLDEWTGRK
jgi:hypothetical protein